MSSQNQPRREPLTRAKRREKTEKVVTFATSGTDDSINSSSNNNGGKKLSLAEMRLKREKEPNVTQERSPNSRTPRYGNEQNGTAGRRTESEKESRYSSREVSNVRSERTSSDMRGEMAALNERDTNPHNSRVSQSMGNGDTSESERNLTLAEMRARRNQEFVDKILQQNAGRDVNQAQARAQRAMNERKKALMTDRKANGVGSNGSLDDDYDSDRSNRKEKSQPLTVAKQRAKREKEMAKYIQETLAPMETEAEVKEKLKRFNVNVDESSRLFRTSLHDLYLNQQVTDTTIHVHQDVFSAHSLVLVAASSLFDKKIRLEKCSYVKLSDSRLPGRVFRHILEFFYSGSLNPKVIVPYMTKGLGVLGMTLPFQKMYGLALAIELPLMEYFDVWSELSQAGLHGAGDVILQHVLRDFPKLCPDSRFLTLGTKQMVDLLSSDNLNTENEETVCDMALHWLGHNAWNEDDAAALFRAMRLHRVSTSYLERYVEDYDMLKRFPACKKIVEDVRYFHDQPGRRHDYYDKRLHFRLTSPLTEVMILFGGVKVDGSPSNRMMAFNFNTRAWCSLGNVPFNLGQDYAYVTYDNDIYVSGGRTQPRQLVRYVPANGRWVKCPPMQIARSGHSMQVVDHSLYLLGGVDENKAVVSEIEEYAIMTRTWRAGSQLIFPVRDACSAVIKDKIYVFGGKMDHRSQDTTSAVQCFDPRAGSMSVINDMTKMVLTHARTVKINQLTYVINQDGRVYEISDDHLTVTEIGAIPEFNRKKFGLYVHHGKILVLGGHFKDAVFGELVCFQPNIHQALVCPWEDMMPPVRSDFAVVKIVMDKSQLKEELLNIDNE